MVTLGFNHVSCCHLTSFPVTVPVVLGDHGDEVWDPKSRTMARGSILKETSASALGQILSFRSLIPGCIPDVHGETDVRDHFQLSE